MINDCLGLGVCGRVEGGKWGVTANWYGVSFWGHENVLKWIEAMDVQLNVPKNAEQCTLGEFYGM